MQKGYEWLWQEPGPKMILEALKLFGTHEIVGKGNSPVILAWAEEVDLAKTYSNDDIPWCGLFMAVVAKRAGKEVPSGSLWAMNWANFGERVLYPMLGDVLTFKRPTGGHVGIYVGEDTEAYHVLGGNQSNAVTITRISKNRVYSKTRPKYSVLPTNVRKVPLIATGELSTNEA